MEELGRYLKGAFLGTMGFCTSWAVDNEGDGLEWIEVVEVSLELEKAGTAFRGKRIVHISDLHCSWTVSSRYLRHCIDRVNLLDADIVILTGDYVTYDHNGRFREKVLDLVECIQSRLGLYACLGNHDYGIGGIFKVRREDRVKEMIRGLEGRGINVLRNASSLLEIEGRGLRFVGLGDLWAGDFEPERALDGVRDDETVIALAHNPDSIRHLHQFDIDAVMCGHTHGIRYGVMGARGESVVNERFHYAGMYDVGGKKLYVNRGLGRLGKAIFNARPEITVFNLR
jgi:predicted MPP superfamily phosphohydrolase